MNSPQEIRREKRRQKEAAATELFETRGLQKKIVGWFGNKKEVWAIPYASHDQKQAIKTLFEHAGVINAYSLVLPEARRGEIIIDTKSALGQSLEHRRLEHEAGNQPDWYRYEKLTGIKAKEAGYYIPYKTDVVTHCHHNSFAHIDWTANDDYDHTGSISADNNSGAKFHLSIAERDLPRAWDAIAPIIIKHRIACKVMRPPTDRLPDMSSDFVDKKIVIYIPRSHLIDDERLNHEKIQSWKRIMTAIDTALHDNGINPAGAITSDKAVSGSDYLYYRYGRTQYNDKGKATNRWDDGLEEATGGVDVFSDFSITRVMPTTARDTISKPRRADDVGRV